MAVSVLPTTDGDGDVSYDDDGRIVEGHDLKAAVFLSLFLDAPARDGDDIPDHATRRGFWADAFNTDGDITGSRLWLLERSKVTAAALADAKTYADEALAWMVRDGVARAVTTSAERYVLTPETQGILLRVVGYRVTGERFSWAWDALTAEEA
jgi:phage gp46-like protein